MDGVTMDYFLIEMVTALRASAAVAAARAKKIEDEMVEAGLIPPPPPAPPAPPPKRDSHRDSIIPIVRDVPGKAKKVDEEDDVRQRLEAIGMHVGANFTERYVFSLPLYWMI